MHDAPYDEINYTAECIVVIRKKMTFSAQPGLNDGERVEIAKEQLKDEIKDEIENIEWIEIRTIK